MLAAMLRQSSTGGSGGGGGGGNVVGSGSSGSKLSLGMSLLPSSHSGSTGPAKTSKSGSSPGADSPGAVISDPNYIMQLVSDVRKFADVLLQLKEVFNSKEHQDCLHHAVHERLGELLRVLKAIVNKHPSLNSVDILSTAGSVITTVKGVNFKEANEENRQKLFGEIYSAIDTLAFTFGNVVSDFLMGDVENGSVLGLPLTKRTRSFENVSAESAGAGLEKDDAAGLSALHRPGEVDRTLQRQDGGVESALLYAKAWSKYTKELLAWVEKRLSVDVECAKSYAKMADSARTLAHQQEFMPFRDIYTAAFKNDAEFSQLVLHTAAVLQSNKFMQPLLTRKNELDKLRKEVKDQWQREQKKMHEAESALRKARLLQAQRQEEYDRAKVCTSRLEEEQTAAAGGAAGGAAAGGAGGGAAAAKQLEKRRRLEEEALQKVEEAREHFRACQLDVGVKRVDLLNTKSDIITQIREMVSQCDLTLKAVTVNWFQLQQVQVVSLPVNHQTLCEHAKLYEPGQRYVDFVRSLAAGAPRPEPRPEPRPLDSSAPSNTGTNKRSLSGTSPSLSSDLPGGDEADAASLHHPKIAERRSNGGADIQALRIQAPLRPWAAAGQGGGMYSDSESAGGSSESRSMDSPTASPGDFKRRLPRTPSTGTMSSADDLDEREPPSPSENGLGEMITETCSSPGPFRNTQMSKAALTHKLRKLRAPSKCRECDSLVVFHGAECEECSLACHKKCLETLAIQCGHKKLQGRLHLFGIDFTQAAKNSADGIPFIIRKCTSEIENRALNIKGIYRVNGAKSRVEKLCQAFENGKDLVELSDLSPHDISNVLKLYLRQLPEPLILFRYYNDLIGLAKESQSLIVEELEARRADPRPVSPAQVGVELNRALFRIRDLLRHLPQTHHKTLQFLIEHLHRVSERSDENKMTASNLGIIFGPTLIKPRQTDAEVSLSSLVDYPYQALMVELLIRHCRMVFDTPLGPVSSSSPVELRARLTPREKEQRLSRHSKSVGDMKEQSSKVYKRHPSIIPSSHLSAEVQENLSNLDGSDFEPGDEVDADNLNGNPSARATDGPKSTRVHLRRPRNKLSSRPVSLPAERIFNRSHTNENNMRNRADRENSNGGSCGQTIEEADETENTKLRVGGAHYRSTFIDTQTLRRTWDKQYKHDTSRTARSSVAGSASGSPAADTSNLSAFSPGTKEGNVDPVFSNRPFTVAVRPGRTLRREDNVTKYVSSTTAFRPPRTLQPPPGTFYKPPSGSKAKALQGSSTSAHSAEEEEEDEEEEEEEDEEEEEEEEELGLEIEVSVDEPLEEELEVNPAAVGESPSSSPEEQNKPVYQRLRPRRLQEVEHREAHFV